VIAVESLRESLKELLRGLREERARTAVTLLGLGWGTFSIVVLLSFGTGLQAFLRVKAAALGRGVTIVWPQRTTRPWAGMGEGRPVLLRAEDVLALPRQIPEVELVSPEYMRRDRVTVGERIHRVQVTGVYPAYETLRSWTPRPGGRFLNDVDIAERRRVAVLGARIAESLFGNEGGGGTAPGPGAARGAAGGPGAAGSAAGPGDPAGSAGPAVPGRGGPVGRSITVGGLPFLVVGVIPAKLQDSSYGAEDADRVCIPATTFEHAFGARLLSTFVYRACDPSLQEQATRRVYEVLGRRLNFDPSDRAALWVWDTVAEELVQSYAFLGFHLMLGGSGVLTLLVGGVGVGNLMFIRVRRRRREIGIIMALGARPRRVLAGILAEAMILAAAGGSLGFALGAVAVALARATPLTATIGRPEISAPLGAATALLLGAVGMLAGYFPARRAARSNPVEALEE